METNLNCIKKCIDNKLCKLTKKDISNYYKTKKQTTQSVSKNIDNKIICSKISNNSIIINSRLTNSTIMDNCTIIDSTLNNCFIMPNCQINNSHLENHIFIQSHCKIRNSTIADNVKIGKSTTIGPYSHIHTNSQISNNCRIGNFVEIKKSKIENNTKIAHLSYIGDTHIKSRVNIGAGTIVCNYDGKLKHPTFIGQNTFIGSNSTIIAPRIIGKNCKIGAGSIVSKDVDDDMFYLKRTREEKYTKNLDLGD